VEFFTDPFQLTFMQRGLIAGLLAGLSCGIVGVWVVVRRVALIGDALAHGVIPGIAVAYLVGVALPLGAAVSAALMVVGVRLASNLRRVGEDTGIGLLFAGMLGLGVLIISRSRSFATDVSHILFGDPLGVGRGDLVLAAVTAVVVLIVAGVGHRAFLALSFDARKAQMLGLRPGVARTVILLLVAATVVASFQTVGALLVFALLVAPAATAGLLVRRAATMMVVAVLLAWSAVVVGLLASYHFSLATGAAIAVAAVLQFFLVAIVDLLRLGRRGRATALENENDYRIDSQLRGPDAPFAEPDTVDLQGKAPL
jgi:zinc/manganese transport system permease protein